jgi:hypothetical protein
MSDSFRWCARKTPAVEDQPLTKLLRGQGAVWPGEGQQRVATLAALSRLIAVTWFARERFGGRLVAMWELTPLFAPPTVL